MTLPRPALRPPLRRFQWSALRGRCRRRLAAGLLLMAVAASYGVFAGRSFSRRGADARAFDRVLVQAGERLTGLPAALRGVQPRDDRELYLLSVITDQQDVLSGMTVFMLRMIAALTIGGIGMLLVAAGSTEWELRSETVPLSTPL